MIRARRIVGSCWRIQARPDLRGQAGFTLPFVLVIIAISVVAVSSVTFMAAHFRSIASAEDGERLYYALDAAVELVMADLVRGADALAPSYSPPAAEINGITPAISIVSPGGAANLAPITEYFDPGLRHPHLVNIPEGERYLLHVLNVHPGSFQVNWAFDVATVGEETPEGAVTLKVLRDVASQAPGRADGCPVGNTLAAVDKSFQSAGSFWVSSGEISVVEPGAFSIAFCVEELEDGLLTNRPFKPTGGLNDTWIYASAFKDYKITAQAGTATLTVYVRQMPGPAQPPTGNWTESNISWITNRVTPYQWSR